MSYFFGYCKVKVSFCWCCCCPYLLKLWVVQIDPFDRSAHMTSVMAKLCLTKVKKSPNIYSVSHQFTNQLNQFDVYHPASQAVCFISITIN